MKSNAVLDSFAVLSFLNRERGYREILRLLQRAEANKITVYLNEINIGECYYILHRNLDHGAAENFLLILKTLPIKIVGNSLDDVIEAAKIKARFPVSYADAFVISTALRYGLPIFTGDPEFRQVEHLVKIRWL